jgi:hypothetical protein
MAMGDTFVAKDESACAQDRNSLDSDDYDMTQMIVDGVVDIGAKRLSA